MYTLLKNFSKLPLKFIQKLAQPAGSLLYFSHSSSCGATEINLASAYPELSEIEWADLTKRSLKSQCMTYAESVKIWGSSTDYVLSLIRNIDCADLFLQALKNLHGCLAVVPHFGTWELLNLWLNQHTSPLIMYKPSKNQNVDRFTLEARQCLNVTLVATNDSGVRTLFKCSKQAGFSAILPDHVPKKSGGIYSLYYNQNALFSILLSKLAAKTQCAVIGLSCLRRDDLSGYDIYVTELSNDILSKDLQLSVDTLNKEMERMINVAPEQYLWGYKRFRKLENDKNWQSKT